MNNENKLVPDFRPETVQTYTETYTPEGGTEQTATYKIGTAHPIISGILDKFAWIKTHVAAVWWNELAGVTLKDKIDTMDESIAQLNGNMEYELFDVTFTSNVGMAYAYAFRRNGIISISFSLKAGASDIIRFTVPEKFRPIYNITGSFSCNGTAADAGKCASVTVLDNGNGYVWLTSALVGDCLAYISYPSK